MTSTRAKYGVCRGVQTAALSGASIIALVAGLSAATSGLAPAYGQSAPQTSAEFNRHWGFGPGEENQPISPGTRDANGNRLIVDGRFVSGSSYARSEGGFGSFGSGGVGWGGNQATAIGNQLTVITTGSYNTVIVDSRQENNGDQNATINLRGGYDVD